MKQPDYPFLKQAGRILNSGQSRSIICTGNIYDLFFLPEQEAQGAYLPLIDFLANKWLIDDFILVVYEINGPIRFVRPKDEDKVKDAWLRWRTGMDANEMAIHRMTSPKIMAQERSHCADFDLHLHNAIGNPTVALEFLRQLCLCSRQEIATQKTLGENFLIIIEGADLIIPAGEIPGLSDTDRHRVNICHDWFSDPGFINSKDSVVLLSESRSLLNQRVSRLPQVMEVDIPAPSAAYRRHFLACFKEQELSENGALYAAGDEVLVEMTAGLSLHALKQLLQGAVYEKRPLSQEEVIDKVEEYIRAQIGEDVVEFKKPSHTLDDVVGFTQLKDFIRDELIPRIGSDPAYALPGAAVCGAIGSGKTFVFEAVAAELDMVVLVLKNVRSQWFGQTDVILERLKRVLEALSKVLIFVDEADTQFGGLGPESHATERRLTGKIQAMMSDPQMRGQVTWLLMTARIHLLSPDIRRPGRVGDLIIPILDPTGEDREAFLLWMLRGVADQDLSKEDLAKIDTTLEASSAAVFSAMRSELNAKKHQRKRPLSIEEILTIVNDYLPPAITETRRYQTLQALVNCTRKQLLPTPNLAQKQRAQWLEEIRLLEEKGIH